MCSTSRLQTGHCLRCKRCVVARAIVCSCISSRSVFCAPVDAVPSLEVFRCDSPHSNVIKFPDHRGYTTAHFFAVVSFLPLVLRSALPPLKSLFRPLIQSGSRDCFCCPGAASSATSPPPHPTTATTTTTTTPTPFSGHSHFPTTSHSSTTNPPPSLPPSGCSQPPSSPASARFRPRPPTTPFHHA
jgi:hypothetical protein